MLGEHQQGSSEEVINFYGSFAWRWQILTSAEFLYVNKISVQKKNSITNTN